ncbi:MAG: hypothetical protein VW405_08960 [Rhodospirillaceae bacterium]
MAQSVADRRRDGSVDGDLDAGPLNADVAEQVVVERRELTDRATPFAPHAETALLVVDEARKHDVLLDAERRVQAAKSLLETVVTLPAGS